MTNNYSGGISLSTALTVAFVILKLCEVITWPWIFVLAPLWISFGVGLIVLIIILLVALVARR